MSEKLFDFEAKGQEARGIVNRRAAWGALVAGLTGPMPGTSIALTGMEAQLTYKIARVYGFYPTIQEAGATITGLVATSGILKYAAIESATAFPVIGWWLIKPSVASVGIKAVGELIIGHYHQKRKNQL